MTNTLRSASHWAVTYREHQIRNTNKNDWNTDFIYYIISGLIVRIAYYCGMIHFKKIKYGLLYYVWKDIRYEASNIAMYKIGFL